MNPLTFTNSNLPVVIPLDHQELHFDDSKIHQWIIQTYKSLDNLFEAFALPKEYYFLISEMLSVRATYNLEMTLVENEECRNKMLRIFRNHAITDHVIERNAYNVFMQIVVWWKDAQKASN